MKCKVSQKRNEYDQMVMWDLTLDEGSEKYRA